MLDLPALGVLGKLDGRAMADLGEVLRILSGIALPSSEKDEDSQSWSIARVRMLASLGGWRRRRGGGREWGFGQGIGQRVRGDAVE